LEVVVEKPENRCPLGLHALIRVRYNGIRQIITDLSNPKFVRSFWLPLAEDGRVVFEALPDRGRKPCFSGVRGEKSYD
jgi:hypothetical protein